MSLVEARASEVPITAACAAVNVSRASLYRARHPAGPPPPRPAAPNARRIPDAERQVILATLHAPEFADQPPTEVYGALLSRGVHLASVRTMYRVLAEVGETTARRPQRAPHTHTMPTVTATAPNQVWTWDITKLATAHKGVFLMAYVIIDLFSRFVVGWMVATKECKHLVAQLFAETIARHGVKLMRAGVSNSLTGSAPAPAFAGTGFGLLGRARKVRTPVFRRKCPWTPAVPGMTLLGVLGPCARLRPEV